MKLDLHLHTTRYSLDSVIDPEELLQRARAVGLDGVVITEHDHIWPEHELQELRLLAPDLVILSGIEVSAVEGDVLVYGVTDSSAIQRGIEWSNLIREVDRQGGVCVLAHPYRWDKPVDQQLAETGVEFAGLERMSNNMTAALRRQAEELHDRFPHWSGLGNSDAHHPEHVGACFTEFAVEVRTNEQLVAAIRLGHTRAVPRLPAPKYVW